MLTRADVWAADADDRALFLRCYAMMTGNVLDAISRDEFDDNDWVDRLLHRFADYYFVALEAYDQTPEQAPAVWQLAHRHGLCADTAPLQKLLLGVSAHINYDLVLTLVDLLEPEWNGLAENRRAARYADHCHINAIIGRTIDAVQDEVLSPSMPSMAFLDRWLGPLDEALIARLISSWREAVWQNAQLMLSTPDEEERQRLVTRVESHALRTARVVCPGSLRLLEG